MFTLTPQHCSGLGKNTVFQKPFWQKSQFPCSLEWNGKTAWLSCWLRKHSTVENFVSILWTSGPGHTLLDDSAVHTGIQMTSRQPGTTCCFLGTLMVLLNPPKEEIAKENCRYVVDWHRHLRLFLANQFKTRDQKYDLITSHLYISSTFSVKNENFWLLRKDTEKLWQLKHNLHVILHDVLL